MTVLVPNRNASSTRGASVFSTSHSGMTTLSSTWLVQNTPPKNVVRSQPGLRSGPGPGILTLRSSGLRSSCAAFGRRLIAAALTRKTRAVNHGSACRTSLEWKARAMPPTQRAEGEADVERGVHVGARLHPLVGREHVDRVRAVRGATERADDLHADGHGDVALEAGDERPQREHRRLTGRAERPHLLRPEAVDELAHRQRRQERRDAGEGQAEADLGGGQPDDLGEEHRRAGHEGALAEGEEQRLGREPSGQR